MSIASELQKYNDGLLDAYSAVNTKGGTVPANKNLDNLPTAINSVPSGGTPQPLDPETVYSETRPADWMPMPAVVDNNEFYGLLHRAADSELGPIYTFYVQNSGTLTAEFGEIVNGEFVADSSLTQQVVNSGYLTCPIPMSAFGNTMSNGVAQLMVKISSTGNITRLQMSSTVGASFHRDMVDVIEHFEGRTAGYSDTYGDMDSLVYSKLITNENDNVSLQGAFSNCHSLTCLRSDGVLKNKSGASCSYIFNGCESLIAIPRINVNEATSLAYAFKDCVRIAAIPSLGDTSSVTSFNNTFKNCYRLQTVPTIDTTNATDCSTMFSACYEMDFAGMSFSLLNCSNLSSAFEMCRNASVLPTLLTSSALTNISFAFRGYENVKSVVVFDTSGVTNFSNVFNDCYALAKPPQLNTSSGTNFSAMFDYCYEMETAQHLTLQMELISIRCLPTVRALGKYHNSILLVEQTLIRCFKAVTLLAMVIFLTMIFLELQQLIA